MSYFTERLSVWHTKVQCTKKAEYNIKIKCWYWKSKSLLQFYYEGSSLILEFKFKEDIISNRLAILFSLWQCVWCSLFLGILSHWSMWFLFLKLHISIIFRHKVHFCRCRINTFDKLSFNCELKLQTEFFSQ